MPTLPAPRLVLLAALALGGACGSRVPSSASTTGSSATARERPPAEPVEAPTLGEDGLYLLAGVRYREYLSGGAEADASLPMVILIHGLGDTPESFEGLVRGFDTPARFIIPRGFDEHGRGWSWFPYRGSDQGVEQTAAGIAASADELAPAIEALSRARPTQGKPAVSGFSQGGMLSFTLALRHGELLSAAYPVGGWLPEPLWPADASQAASCPPILAFHGEDDDRVPLAPTRAGVEHLRALGYPVELRTYPELGHSINRELHAELMQAFRAQLQRSSG